jgi:hypothetical protein
MDPRVNDVPVWFSWYGNQPRHLYRKRFVVLSKLRAQPRFQPLLLADLLALDGELGNLTIRTLYQ